MPQSIEPDAPRVSQSISGADVCDWVEFGETVGRRILADPSGWTQKDGERLLETLREAGVSEAHLPLAVSTVVAAARRVMGHRVRQPI